MRSPERLPAPGADVDAVADVHGDDPAGGLRILLLSHAFNGLTQRLFVELRAAGHQVSVELDISEAVTEEAVALADPDVVIAPFLKRRIAEPVWSRRLCLVVHPGPPGDRGPSALDWAVLQGRSDWGVTVLQATADFDAGPVWAWQPLRLREGATKASLYRHDVVPAAVTATLAALRRVVRGSRLPTAAAELPPALPGMGWQPLVTAEQRRIDWATHDTATVLRRVRSADSAPGAGALLWGEPCKLFDAHAASAGVRQRALATAPGTLLARRGPAVLVRTADGAVWIAHVRRAPDADGTPALKLAATLAFAEQAAALPEWPAPLWRPSDLDANSDSGEWDELQYSELGPPGGRIGWLEFNFHNGAMGERQCRRLIEALRFAATRDTQVLVLAGGTDFFSNGIHLHEIEAAARREGDSAADASMRNIEAIDDVALALLQLTDRLTVAALRGNAGAGGCFLALAADRVWAHRGVLLNPHYKNMGNLYGSEYWTYLLPHRVGEDAARALMQGRLPMGAAQAVSSGLIDDCFGADAAAFELELVKRALALAATPDRAAQVAAKRQRREADEATRPLAAYRADELARLRRNFYGFDASYHVARHHFVHRKLHAWTPRHLATHRR